MNDFQYADWVYKEMQRVIRGLFSPGTPLKRVSQQEDFGGIDCQYVVNHACPLAIRARFERPAYAADSDITFRTTEPRMMAARTYAPLAVFFWFRDRHVVAAKLIDIYRMAQAIDPPLADRPVTGNGDGTGFVSVAISELHDAQALLRLYDGSVWATATLGGEARLNQLLKHWWEQAS